MTTFTPDVQTQRVQDVHITDDGLTGDLADGRTISVPLVGIHVCCMAHGKSSNIGASLLTVWESTGRILRRHQC